MNAIVKLLRVKQWVKNLFLFIPNFFAGELFYMHSIEILAQGALLFSLISSGVYILNDLKDIEADRLHPKKKERPLASGKVKKGTAILLCVVLMGTGLGGAYLLSIHFFYLVVSYILINLSYSFGLKHISILDLFLVSSGFLIRIYSGGVLADVPITNWVSLMILLLALFIIIAKRRDDLVIQIKTGEAVRQASKSYNLEFVNSCLTMFSAVIVVAYIMATISPELQERFHTDYLYATSIFVIAGIMRYLQITFVEQDSGSPTSILLKDKFILITILGWIISFYFIIYKYQHI